MKTLKWLYAISLGFSLLSIIILLNLRTLQRIGSADGITPDNGDTIVWDSVNGIAKWSKISSSTVSDLVRISASAPFVPIVSTTYINGFTTTNTIAKDILVVPMPTSSYKLFEIYFKAISFGATFTSQKSGFLTGAVTRFPGMTSGNVRWDAVPNYSQQGTLSLPASPIIFTLDTVNQTVRFQANGIASTTINWEFYINTY